MDLTILCMLSFAGTVCAVLLCLFVLMKCSRRRASRSNPDRDLESAADNQPNYVWTTVWPQQHTTIGERIMEDKPPSYGLSEPPPSYDQVVNGSTNIKV